MSYGTQQHTPIYMLWCCPLCGLCAPFCLVLTTVGMLVVRAGSWPCWWQNLPCGVAAGPLVVVAAGCGIQGAKCWCQPAGGGPHRGVTGCTFWGGPWLILAYWQVVPCPWLASCRVQVSPGLVLPCWCAGLGPEAPGCGNWGGLWLVLTHWWVGPWGPRADDELFVGG